MSMLEKKKKTMSPLMKMTLMAMMTKMMMFLMMMTMMVVVVRGGAEHETVSSVAPNTTTVTLGYNMRTYSQVTARTLEFFGEGPNWKNVSGVPSFWIDSPQPFQVG